MSALSLSSREDGYAPTSTRPGMTQLDSSVGPADSSEISILARDAEGARGRAEAATGYGQCTRSILARKGEGERAAAANGQAEPHLCNPRQPRIAEGAAGAGRRRTAARAPTHADLECSLWAAAQTRSRSPRRRPRQFRTSPANSYGVVTGGSILVFACLCLSPHRRPLCVWAIRFSPLAASACVCVETSIHNIPSSEHLEFQA